MPNLHGDIPPAGPEEHVEILQRWPGGRIERIISHGHASPAGFWYDQPEAEWVLLVAGEAELRFEDEPEPRKLMAGDWLHIAPRRRHRVEQTSNHGPTVWLAVFHEPEEC